VNDENISCDAQGDCDEGGGALLEQLYAELTDRVRQFNPNADFSRIRAAYELALSAHKGQRRRDGTPYATHTVAAAEIAAEMGLDEDSIIAALLHDTLEDTSLTYDDIAKRFGVSVADIVEGVTKLTRVQYTSKEDEQMENLRKMLMAMAKDIRVILIKIADRLHNMRTMAYQSPEKQRAKSLETMEIYAPIAHRLGMQKIKWELEDLSLLYLDPVGYREITEALEKRHIQLERFMQSAEERIGQRLSEWGINAAITGRMKHIYSIYRKMYAQKKDLSEIFDLCALRIIVDSIPDCYNVLGHIHDMFRLIPGRFKDYISMPKPNLYQSLHTTVIGTEGIPFEVQIRTWEMHQVAEYGIAAHWKYKSGESGVRSGDEEKFAWVRRLLETQQDSDAQDFVHDLKVEMFADEVFVFTPKGDVINLPAGATPIDFAYAIHSAVGNRMTGAKVNGRIVPLSAALRNGDIVEVLTQKNASGPSRDWLKLAKSGEARSKIKQWFKKEKREENIAEGRVMFEGELKRAGLTMADVTDAETLPILLKRIAVGSLDDMFASIGYGGMTALRAVNRVRDEILRLRQSAPKDPLQVYQELAERNEKLQKKKQRAAKTGSGVMVEGLDSFLVKFARCCTPVPGDDIVGYVTRGAGVSVHRKDCPNYLGSLSDPEEQGRWVEVSWAPARDEGHLTTLKLAAKDRNNLVVDIATALSAMSAKVRGLSARSGSRGLATVTLTVEVKDLNELNAITARLGKIADVSEVVRGQ